MSTRKSLYGDVTDRALPYGAVARDYIELALAAFDQAGVPLGPIVAALPQEHRAVAYQIDWVRPDLGGQATYEIKRADVGQSLLRIAGRAWQVSSFMGRILKGDVGKIVIVVGDHISVENDDQRAARLAKRAP
jgi:hypothetical protein